MSDLSDDEMQLVKVPEPIKPAVISFKHKDDTDLFGLGFKEEPLVAKDSSEEQEGKSSGYIVYVVNNVHMFDQVLNCPDS